MTTRTRTLSTTGPRTLTRGLVAAGGAAVLALGLGACGDTAGDEEGTSVADVQGAEEEIEPSPTPMASDDTAYDGEYDAAFYDQQEGLVGQEVTLSAAVNEVIDDTSFTIASGDSGVEPLLVVDAGGSAAMLEPDVEVDVSGTVAQTFVVTEVEEDLGIDLDDELYADFESQNYIVASAVDVGVESTS